MEFSITNGTNSSHSPFFPGNSAPLMVDVSLRKVEHDVEVFLSTVGSKAAGSFRRTIKRYTKPSQVTDVVLSVLSLKQKPRN